MIKNNIQLKRATSRLREVRQQVKGLREQYVGIELENYTNPLVDEANELEGEIIAYQKLRELTLEQALRKTLKEPVLLDNIGELLAKLRIASGLTQEDLATKLGWQQSNLSRFESENYNSQTIAKIVEYASSLGVWLLVSPSLTENLPEDEPEEPSRVPSLPRP